MAAAVMVMMMMKGLVVVGRRHRYKGPVVSVHLLDARLGVQISSRGRGRVPR